MDQRLNDHAGSLVSMSQSDRPEAGPSKPRTPPATPPSSSKPRRSWFAFGSPTVTSSSQQASPSQSLGTSIKGRRKSSPLDEGLELVAVGQVARRSSDSQGGDYATSNQASVDGADELLTLDGKPVSSVKKKKKRRSKPSGPVIGGDIVTDSADYFETVRMQDLSISSGSRLHSRRESETTIMTMDEGDRPPSNLHDLEPTFPPPLSGSTIPRRISSMPKDPTMAPATGDLGKPVLAPPHLAGKMLPPLPPDPSLRQSVGPVVTTPRSPVAHVHGPRPSRSAADMRSVPVRQSSTDRGRSVSDGRTNTGPIAKLSRDSSPIGLGLPVGFTPTRSGSTLTDGAPPLPPKPQSVSSPNPSRSNSPAPKISFTEPEIVKDAHTRGRAIGQSGHQYQYHQETEADKRTRAKRARSLSGIFSKSPLLLQGQKAESSPSGPSTPNEPGSHNGGSGGMLEWLGVKKGSKRRTSESNLLEKKTPSQAPAHERTSGPKTQPLPPNDEASKSKETIVAPHSSGMGSTSSLLRPDRPSLNSEISSATTVTPNTTANRGSAIFARRSNSTLGETVNTPVSLHREVTPVPRDREIQPRTSTSGSARSSFSLPPAKDAVASAFGHEAPWMASPASEAEEILFVPQEGSVWGPGMRPWLDGAAASRPRSSSVNPADQITAAAQMKDAAAGRFRSHSDAPQPSPNLIHGSSAGRSPQLGSTSHTSSPLAPPSRPKLGSRSNSGNSAIIGRMKNVFTKSSRNRSSSLLQPGSDMDECTVRPVSGTVGSPLLFSQSMRPSSSASTYASAPRSPMPDPALRNVSLLDLVDGERQVGLYDSPTRSVRTSFSGTVSSAATGSTRHSTAPVPAGEAPAAMATGSGRARASTVSFAASAPSSDSASSFPTFATQYPVSATPPRQRPSAISRLSGGLLSSNPSSPKHSGGSLFPLPPRSSGGISPKMTSRSTLGSHDEFGGATRHDPLTSAGPSPRPSLGSISTGANFKALAKREPEETPEVWLDRMQQTIGRHDIAMVLAASGDAFHQEAIKMYMARFNFKHHALDVALRKLLMHMSLPKETQQIDRVIEAFANRYDQCEPGLFESKDNTYVLAFSMMMLHTDAFNKHNKNKMSKTDYVRNTRMDGVPPFALEAFFDNITYTPFVFVEDDGELRGASGFQSPSTGRSSSTPSSASPSILSSSLGMSTPMATSLSSRGGRVDVYDAISKDLTPTLRVDVEHAIPAESPLSCLGTRPFLDMDSLHRAFASANSIRVTAASQGSGSTKKKGSNKPFVAPGDPVAASDETLVQLTKVGLLSRKDDGIDAGKKSSRKWKSWSVVLTGSQLLFFKDPMWALTLLEQSRAAAPDAHGQKILPPMAAFKPDEVFPAKDCFAVFDRATWSPGTPATVFRFIMPHGRQYLLQASDEYEMNEWIGLINYASAFKTVGIRMRSSHLAKDQAALAGAAAAASYRRDVQIVSKDGDLANGPSTRPLSAERLSSQGRRLGSVDASDPDVATAPSGDLAPETMGPSDTLEQPADALEEVFDVVKAELAAGRGGAPALPEDKIRGKTPAAKGRAHMSRADAIEAQIRNLEAKASPVERDLRNSLRLARNLAILTPFQKSTRERLASYVPGVADRVRADRLALSKLRMYITILRKDLERETREFARVRHVALQAASKSLRDPDGVQGVVRDIHAGETGRKAPVPKLSLPPEEVDPTPWSPSPSPTDSFAPGRRPSYQSGRLSPHTAGDETDYSDMTDREADEPHRPSSYRFGVSPGELPIMIRQSSESGRDGAGGNRFGPRPPYSRQASANSVWSDNGSRRGSADARRSSVGLLNGGSHSRHSTPRDLDSPGSLGAPLMFSLEDEAHERPMQQTHPAPQGTARPMAQ